MITTELVLLRHASTALSGKVYCGITDMPLSEAGIREAEAARARANALPKADILLCSPLMRAVQTAEIVCPGQKITLCDELKETSFGAWEGLSYAQIMEKDAENLTLWGKDPFRFAPPGGESGEMLYRRCEALMHKISHEFAGKCIWLSGHGGMMGMLLSHLLHGHADAQWHYELRRAHFAKVRLVDGFAVLTDLNR